MLLSPSPVLTAYICITAACWRNRGYAWWAGKWQYRNFPFLGYKRTVESFVIGQVYRSATTTISLQKVPREQKPQIYRFFSWKDRSYQLRNNISNIVIKGGLIILREFIDCLNEERFAELLFCREYFIGSALTRIAKLGLLVNKFRERLVENIAFWTIEPQHTVNSFNCAAYKYSYLPNDSKKTKI